MARPQHLNRATLITPTGVKVHKSYQFVSDLVQEEKAVWVDAKTARYVGVERKQPLQCEQGEAYFSLGIEKYPQIFAGGLTRTEHQPSVKPSILRWGHLDDNKPRQVA